MNICERLVTHHITFLYILLVYNQASVNVFTRTSFPFLFPYWDCWRNPTALGLPQQSCSLAFLFSGDTYQMMSSVFGGESHQHLSLVVHHHSHHHFPVASPNPAQNRGQMGWVLWARLKSCGYSGTVIHLNTSTLCSLVVLEILNMEGEQLTMDYGEWTLLLMKISALKG